MVRNPATHVVIREAMRLEPSRAMTRMAHRGVPLPDEPAGAVSCPSLLLPFHPFSDDRIRRARRVAVWGILAGPLAVTPPRLFKQQVPMHQTHQRLETVIRQPTQPRVVPSVLQAQVAAWCRVPVLERPVSPVEDVGVGRAIRQESDPDAFGGVSDRLKGRKRAQCHLEDRASR
jgi:hypothetical protein